MKEHVTHEPEIPVNWPIGHVSVSLSATEVDECVKVKIHDSIHFLHATTARELQKMLECALDDFNKSGTPFPV